MALEKRIAILISIMNLLNDNWLKFEEPIHCGDIITRQTNSTYYSHEYYLEILNGPIDLLIDLCDSNFDTIIFLVIIEDLIKFILMIIHMDVNHKHKHNQINHNIMKVL